jgi:hypothetical protein
MDAQLGVIATARVHVKELLANLAVIALVPLLARILWPKFSEAFTQFGFGDLVSMLAGNGGWTDIGWEVASAIGLIRGDFSAYDSLEVLHPLVGMELIFVDLSSHSHPPMSIPLGIPLGFIDYGWWLSFWVVAAIVMIALSLRLLKVPPHVAYPLALLISLSVPGKWGLVSTYPLAALLIAIAWRFRNKATASGVSLGLFGATRGIGLLMLIYPFARRQWRTLAIAVAVVLGLLLVAVAFEPGIIREFLTTSRSSIEANMQRADLLTPGSILRRYGFSEYLFYIVAIGIVAIAIKRKQELFWVLNWLILAVSPIAWFHSIVMGIPLLVMIWRSGKLGQSLVLIVAAAAISQPVNPFTTLVFSIDWIVFVLAGAIAIVFCPIKQREQVTLFNRSLENGRKK